MPGAGKRDDGVMIKEYEASHGTVADMWEDHLAGKETSLNPLGMVEALVGAMCHAESLDPPADGACPRRCLLRLARAISV